MANWHYYNENSEKIGPVRGRELKQLAQQGAITPNTRVEDENGLVALAKQVTGLSFPESTPIPNVSDSYSVASSTSDDLSSIVVPPPSAQPKANWYYFNGNKEKFGPITSGELKQLVLQGTVTPETFIEDPTGRTGLAKDVKGLIFPEAVNGKKTTPTYHYIDEIGYKHGPIPAQQLQALVDQGIVTPMSQLETDAGHKELAGQIPGLQFKTAVSPLDQPSQSAPSSPKNTVRDFGKTAFSWVEQVTRPEPAQTSSPTTPLGRSTSHEKIDYKRNKLYFYPKPPKQSGGFFGSAIVIGIGILLPMTQEFLLVIFGLALIVVGILWIVKTYRSNEEIAKYNKTMTGIPDGEIDQAGPVYVMANLYSMASSKLCIDEDELRKALNKPNPDEEYNQEMYAIRFHGYCYDNIPGADVIYKLGKDGDLRASNYEATLFIFSPDQVSRYQLRFSLLENSKQEITNECFYGDIVDVSVVSSTLSVLKLWILVLLYFRWICILPCFHFFMNNGIPHAKDLHRNPDERRTHRTHPTCFLW